MIERLRERAREIKRQSYALYLAARHPGVPWYAKAMVGLVAAYAFSPIDLIPDFIPVLGYADDAVVVALVLRSVVRRSGADAVTRHWPGTPEGLAALNRLVGLPA